MCQKIEYLEINYKNGSSKIEKPLKASLRYNSSTLYSISVSYEQFSKQTQFIRHTQPCTKHVSCKLLDV